MIKISDFPRSYFNIIVRKLMTLYIEKHLRFLLGCIECMRCSLFLPMFATSFCLSVTRLISASVCKNGWTDQDAIRGEHSRGPWSPREEERTQFYLLPDGYPRTRWVTRSCARVTNYPITTALHVRSNYTKWMSRLSKLRFILFTI